VTLGTLNSGGESREKLVVIGMSVAVMEVKRAELCFLLSE
jgi:hypothetical protein